MKILLRNVPPGQTNAAAGFSAKQETAETGARTAVSARIGADGGKTRAQGCPHLFSVMVGMARRAAPARVVAGGTSIRATLTCEGVAPLHAARTSQRDVPTMLNTSGCPRAVLQQFIGLGLFVITALLPLITMAQFTGGPPVINKQPQSQIVAAGSNVTNTVGTAPSFTPVRYQWQKFGYDLAGATNSTLVISNAALSHAGNYAVVVANAAGSIQSATASLTVAQASANPPSVSLGASVTLRVIAAGSPIGGYQWKFGGVNIPGASKSTLVLTNVQLANAGTYSVVVTNEVGSVTVSTSLSVDPQFTKITTGS